MDKTVLVPGGAGFVGSNLAISFKQKHPFCTVIALDNLKRRGSELNLNRLRENGVNFVHGDIRNPEDLSLDQKIDLILECSAESSVLAGYNGDPAYVINTNLVGTVNCLELARKNSSDVIFLSTSRVYPYDSLNSIPSVEKETRWEWSAYGNTPGWSPQGIDVGFTLQGPKSLYGATKLCTEIILQEYISMYGLRGIVNRCGVLAGPWQFGKVDQGVFSLWMLAHYFKKNLKYIGFGGKGKQVRDLLHIDDLFELLDFQISCIDEVNGNVYNVGGGRDVSLSLREATKLCQEITTNKVDIKVDENNREADIKIYITNNSKVLRDFNWKPKKKAEEILIDIYKWIKENENELFDSLLV